MSEVKVNKISPRTNCGTTQLGDAGDTITVTGDLKSNSIKSASGSTITLGQSGDTIQLGCGASQTGFGRTGTVDWDTTAKTASFTAVSGNGYFVDTTSGAVTATLPASPSAGDIVAVSDYAGTTATNNITIARNGSNINGSTNDLEIQRNNSAIFLVYVDATQGWKNSETSNLDDIAPEPTFITATGGTITTCGNCKIHTFTSPGTFCVSCLSSCSTNNEVSYLVIAGGGGGGTTGGGGGAGGFRENKSPVTPYTASPLEGAGAITVTATGFPITVGGGGAGTPGCQGGGRGGSGSNSVFSTKTSAGGGGGGGSGGVSGLNGGSGGGGTEGACQPCSSPQLGGSGNTPPVSPPQGNSGGDGGAAGNVGAGGGGATGTGGNAGPGNNGGPAGAGATTSISGSAVARAGGGGGGGNPGVPGTAGGGRGGLDGQPGPNAATAGTANTGGGGGGGGRGCGYGPGAAGGSGIVIIRYKYQ
jgi:hypothetical protein